MQYNIYTEQNRNFIRRKLYSFFLYPIVFNNKRSVGSHEANIYVIIFDNMSNELSK